MIYNLKNKIKSGFYKFYDWNNLRQSKKVKNIDIKTICLILGPYGNLTTLFSSILYLHPSVNVLNHAGIRIYGNKDLDFLLNNKKRVIENFIRFSIVISSKGEAGPYGGSITHSHAFQSSKVKALLLTDNKKKKNSQIRSIIWKESLLNSNIIHSKRFDLHSLMKKEKRLRFLLPIRNPLDCVVSNMKTGHYKKFKNIDSQSTSYDVLEKVLDEIYLFKLKNKKFPDKYFYFFENDLSEDIFVDVAKFLKIKPDKNWVINAKSLFVVKLGYNHDNNFVKFYKESIEKKFSSFPLFMKKLQSFC